MRRSDTLQSNCTDGLDAPMDWFYRWGFRKYWKQRCVGEIRRHTKTGRKKGAGGGAGATFYSALRYF